MSRATRTKAREENTLFGDQATPAAESKPTPEKTPKKTKAKGTEVAVASNVETLPVAKPENLIASLFDAIIDPKIGPEKVTVLVDIRERLMREKARVEFMTMYVDLQSVLPSINRDGKLDQGTTRSGKQGVASRFATYENIRSEVDKLLRERRMALIATPDVPAEGHGILIRASLSYVCDTDFGKYVYSIEANFPLPRDDTGGKSPPQGIGSSMKYGMRYAYIALLGIVSHDPRDAGDLDSDKRTRKPADGEQLTKAQIEALKKAIEFCGVGEAKFCEHYKIEKVEDLPAKMLDEAMQACRDFVANKPAEKAGG